MKSTADELTITIVFLAIPGIVCYFILSKLIGGCGKNTIERVLLIFLFSILSYLLLDFFIPTINSLFCTQLKNNTLENIFKNRDAVTINKIVGASIISVLLAFVLSYLYNYKVLNKFGQFIKTTKRYGDEDVWHYFHNTYSKNGSEVYYVRDMKNNLCYVGHIKAFSEQEENRELLMYNVIVYENETAIYLYNAKDIYLCLNKDEIKIEIAPLIKNVEDKNEI